MTHSQWNWLLCSVKSQLCRPFPNHQLNLLTETVLKHPLRSFSFLAYQSSVGFSNVRAGSEDNRVKCNYTSCLHSPVLLCLIDILQCHLCSLWEVWSCSALLRSGRSFQVCGTYKQCCYFLSFSSWQAAAQCGTTNIHRNQKNLVRSVSAVQNALYVMHSDWS